MSSYLEKFEKMRIAGSLASKTLDMITDYVKEGTATNHIDNPYGNGGSSEKILDIVKNTPLKNIVFKKFYNL